MKPKIQSVKGTRDFYPEQMALRNWLYGNMRAASQLFGYQEYDGPFLETLDLYAAKSGEELVKEQSFVFNDRGGDQITLRPELTPSLARMVAARQAPAAPPHPLVELRPVLALRAPAEGPLARVLPVEHRPAGRGQPRRRRRAGRRGRHLLPAHRVHARTEVKLQFNNRRLMDAEIAALGLADNKTGRLPPDRPARQDERRGLGAVRRRAGRHARSNSTA